MKTTRTTLGDFGLWLSCLAFSCATASGGGKSGASGTATGEQLQARNQALDNLIVEALSPCKTKGKPQDSGVVIVSAKPDGAISVGPMLWQGSDEMKQCIVAEVPKAHLAAWNGPSVTWIWALGTKDVPPPKPLAEPPASFKEREREHVQRAQGNTGMGNDVSTGPLASCAQRSLTPDSFAQVTVRVFVFPDGKVVGVTPIRNEGEGKDAAFMDCVSDIAREWTFTEFPGPAFTTLDVVLKYGVDAKD